MDTHRLIKNIIEELVDHPEDVEVHEVYGQQCSVLEVSVRASDYGKVIGREGRTANALRTLLANIGAKNGRNYKE